MFHPYEESPRPKNTIQELTLMPRKCITKVRQNSRGNRNKEYDDFSIFSPDFRPAYAGMEKEENMNPNLYCQTMRKQPQFPAINTQQLSERKYKKPHVEQKFHEQKPQIFKENQFKSDKRYTNDMDSALSEKDLRYQRDNIPNPYKCDSEISGLCSKMNKIKFYPQEMYFSEFKYRWLKVNYNGTVYPLETGRLIASTNEDNSLVELSFIKKGFLRAYKFTLNKNKSRFTDAYQENMSCVFSNAKFGDDNKHYDICLSFCDYDDLIYFINNFYKPEKAHSCSKARNRKERMNLNQDEAVKYDENEVREIRKELIRAVYPDAAVNISF